MAVYYFRNTGDQNWGTASNWSLTDGGGATGAVPTAADDAKFTVNSGSCTLNASARVCKSIDFTGYTQTFDMAQTLTVSGNVTLVAAMTITGASTLIVNAASTLTSNGKTWPSALSLTTITTYTLADNWTVTGMVTVGGATGGTTTINGNNVYCDGGLTGNSTALISGTTILVVRNGTWTHNATGRFGGTSVHIDGGLNTVTVSGPRVGGAGTIKYISGAIGPNPSLTITATGSIFECNGITFTSVSVSIGGSGTMTLNESLNTDVFNVSLNTNGVLTINGQPLNVTTTLNMTWGGGVNTLSGTSVITLVGNTTILKGHTSHVINNLVRVNSPGGVVNLTGTGAAGQIHLRGGLTHDAGTLNVVAATMTIAGTWTMNVATLTAATMWISGNTTFAGAFGYNINYLRMPTPGFTLTLKAGLTYTQYIIQSDAATSASRCAIKSDTAGVKAFFVLSNVPGSIQLVRFTNVTDIDSSGGLTIWNFDGVLTNTINWKSLVPPTTQAYTFVN